MRIGMLGGTFNPIHNAHVQMALCARDALALDRVLLMVTADPPHKAVEGQIGSDARLTMARLAAEGLERVEASDRELRRAGKSYTADTLSELAKDYPGAALYLIVGSDMLADMPHWYAPGRIAALAKIAYVPRIGQEAGDQEAARALEIDFGAATVALEKAADALSSTQIRERLQQGLPVDGMLPERVLWYCYEEGLYFPAPLPGMIKHLRGTLSEKRFRHSIGTMMQAARLAESWGADPQKTRLAALLHDCAKNLQAGAMAKYSDDESGILAVQHAFAGAALAKSDYGVEDGEILSAIRHHCTGEAGMSLMDKIVYLADITEPTRDFPGVEEIRASLTLGPDEAMLFALTRSAAILRKTEDAGAMHPATQRAIDYFTQIKKEEQD